MIWVEGRMYLKVREKRYKRNLNKAVEASSQTDYS